MISHENLSALFTPESVAIIGASATPGKIGNIILANLIQAGFKGKIYPVNPRGGNILGLNALSKVEDIPENERPLDLAVICLPAEHVPDSLKSLGTIPTKAAVVISAGFKEVGGEGLVLEETVKKLAEENNMVLLGPNCLGLVNTSSNLNVTFGAGEPVAGNIGFFSQSGAIVLAIFDWAKSQKIGFSSFVSLGNKAVTDESDFMAYLAKDKETKVIAGYLESVEKGQQFLRNAHMATRKKPIVILKSGRTEAGARAASSHTGALAGADMAYEAAFKQTGIIRAYTMEELFALTQAFSTLPLPEGPGVGIVTNSGGPGIMATDACGEAGLTMARLSPGTLEELKAILPAYASLYNPIDVVGDASPDRFAKAVNIVLKDPAVHSLLLLACPTARTPVEDIAREITKVLETRGKPVYTCLMGGEGVVEGRNIFTNAGLPCYSYPEPAVFAISSMYRYKGTMEKPLPVEVGYRRDLGRARKVIEEARAQDIDEIVEFQAQGLLKAYEMPVLESRLARTSQEAVQIFKQINGPVALKIASPQISHKTDVRGVVLNLDTPEKVSSAFLDITSRAIRMRPGAYIAGCLVQAMAPPGFREVIVGFKRDQRFGPMVIFGLGGIHVEVFKDIAARLAPLSLDDARDMIREIKAYPLLAGTRGQPPIKFTALEDILLIMSQLAQDFPEIQEAECNPVLVNENGALVGDIRVILTPPKISDQ